VIWSSLKPSFSDRTSHVDIHAGVLVAVLQAEAGLVELDADGDAVAAAATGPGAVAVVPAVAVVTATGAQGQGAGREHGGESE